LAFSIQQFDHSEELIRLTVAQLNKDMASTGHAVHWNGNTFNAYAELIHQLENIIKAAGKANSATFHFWLNRVDIPEHVMRKIMNAQSDRSPLAKAILERTFIKIMFRKKYRSDE
jgi:hypothetical protein